MHAWAVAWQSAHDRGGIGRKWSAVVTAFHPFVNSEAQCRGGSCCCLELQASLEQMCKAAQQQPGLDALVELRVHLALPCWFQHITDCPHAAATRLAIADTFYK